MHYAKPKGRAEDADLHTRVGEYDLLIGTAKNDRHDPDALMTVAFGRDGNDQLAAASHGADLLGGKGNDQLIGGAGPDHLDGGKGNDRLSGGDMADNLVGGDGNDILNEGAGHGDLEGGQGNDILIGGPGADAFAIAPDSGNDVIKDFVAGPGMFDHLAVNGLKPENLHFTDTDRGVLISWDIAEGKGSVLLENVSKKDLAQNDFMFTDDRYLIKPTAADADHVTAISFAKNEGGDLQAGNDGTQTRAASLARAFDDFNVKFGTEGSDTYQGMGQRDMYFGQGGNDRLYGRAGDDHLSGDAGNDVLDGGEGRDDLRGGTGNDKLYGGAEADGLMGDEGNDYLAAGAGHDMVDGGKGNDILNGGDGADAYIVSHGSGNDRVVGGFDAGPGAFDHIAFMDILPEDVRVEDLRGGVLVSWGDGSIFLEGISKAQMSQDDFMFSAVEGGGFVNDPMVSKEGTQLIFQEQNVAQNNDPHHSYVMA